MPATVKAQLPSAQQLASKMKIGWNLGNTLEAIAREKGGIIKKGGICITASKQKRVVNVLKDICLKRRAKLLRLGRDIKIHVNVNGYSAYLKLDKEYLINRLKVFLPNIIIHETNFDDVDFLNGIDAHYYVMNENNRKEIL